MRLSSSKYLIPTLREAPSDADNVSAQLMIRAGMIRKVASGIYEWLPLGLRVLRKVERVIREEMDAIEGAEARKSKANTAEAHAKEISDALKKLKAKMDEAFAPPK